MEDPCYKYPCPNGGILHGVIKPFFILLDTDSLVILLLVFKLLSNLFIRLLIRVYNQKYADALKMWNLQVGSKSNLGTNEAACSLDYCILKGFFFFLKLLPSIISCFSHHYDKIP